MEPGHNEKLPLTENVYSPENQASSTGVKRNMPARGKSRSLAVPLLVGFTVYSQSPSHNVQSKSKVHLCCEYLLAMRAVQKSSRSIRKPLAPLCAFLYLYIHQEIFFSVFFTI